MSRSFSPNLYFFGRWLVRQTLGRIFRLQVQGLEYLPATGPAIICPKHQRWEDIPMIGAALPLPLHYIAKAELFRQPFFRSTLSSFKKLLPLLEQQACIVLFPEGTYFPGRMGPGKHRLIQLLLKLQGRNGLTPLPFFPVGLAYHPRDRGYDVAVNIGPPLSSPAPRQAVALTAALMDRIARLCE